MAKRKGHFSELGDHRAKPKLSPSAAPWESRAWLRRGSSREDAVMLPSGTEGASIVLPVFVSFIRRSPCLRPGLPRPHGGSCAGVHTTSEAQPLGTPTAARMKAPGRLPGDQLPLRQLKLLIGQLIQPDTFSAPGGSCSKNLKGYMSHSPERLRGSREDQSQDRFS